MNYNVLIVNSLLGVQHLPLIFGSIVQFDEVALGRIKHSFQMVILPAKPLAQTRTLLAGNSFRQLLLCFSGKRSLQRVESVELQRLGDARPRQAIVAEDSALRQAFDCARPGLVCIQLHLDCSVSSIRIERRTDDESECRHDAGCAPKVRTAVHRAIHGCTPMRSSFPITTPDATEITAAPEAMI
jgi:hypothetical protein